jgi:hypothetical protein
VSTGAEAFRLSRATVRDQLKSIFAKTDTHRQSELVARRRVPGGGGVALFPIVALPMRANCANVER